MSEFGVVIAADLRQSWMIPWWWKHFSLHSDLPVCVIDYGLAPETRYFIDREVGQRILVDCGMQGWHIKPSALRHSPFQTTLWIDVDCQVCDSLERFRRFIEDPRGNLAMRRDVTYPDKWSKSLLPGEEMYNTGVMLVGPGMGHFLEAWENHTKFGKNWFRSDQEVLSRLIHLEGTHIIPMTPADHTLRLEMPLQTAREGGAAIYHWTGPSGKQHIYNQINAATWIP